MPSCLRPGVLAGVLLLPILAVAAQVQTVTVEHLDSGYRIDLKVRLDAPPARAYAVFTDFGNLHLLNPAVREEQVTAGQGSNSLRLRTDIHACVAFFCRMLRQVQDVELQPDQAGGHMHADMIPALSDFDYGTADWSFDPCEDDAHQTCMRFVALAQPKFWIPPLIGPWLIERRMRDESVITARGIERLARDGAALVAQ